MAGLTITAEQIGPYKIHPVTALVPDIDEAHWPAFRNSIGEKGLKHPILRYQNQVIQGRQRLRACLETNTPPKFVDWSPKGKTSDSIYLEIFELVKAEDLDRRHLSDDQLAMTIIRMTKLAERGRPSKTSEKPESKMAQSAPITLKQAANAFDVSKDRLKRAKATIKGCIAPIVKLVDANQISVADAANVAELEPKLQKACLAELKAERSHSLTAARAKLCSNRTGISAKTSTYVVLVELEIMAETADLAVDMVERGNEECKTKAVGLKGKPLLPFVKCCRPDCGKLLFEGDERKVSSEGVACRQCPDGRTRER